jgi:acetate kinase
MIILNAGSSSLKFSIFTVPQRDDQPGLLCHGVCDGMGHHPHVTASDHNGIVLMDRDLAEGTTHESALAALLRWVEGHFQGARLIAAGHRVLHGGPGFVEPVRITAAVMAELRGLIPLAPLHQPHNLAAITAVATLHRDLAQVACFDTAFHHTQPMIASTFALPRALTAEGIRRYGFHGLSYEYIAGVLPDILGPQSAEGRIVVAHLGSGASLCALHHRRSVATTMSFTALDGLPMGSRCGSLDPGVVLYLIEEKGMTPQAVRDLLYHQSGWLGVSGLSNDMRVLLASDDPHAAEAIDLFVYRIGRELGSLAASLGGLDALIFTAGIGEHALAIQRRVCEQAAWLGIAFDPAAPPAGTPRLTTPGSAVSAWMIPTNEDLMIAQHTWRLMRDEGR